MVRDEIGWRLRRSSGPRTMMERTRTVGRSSGPRNMMERTKTMGGGARVKDDDCREDVDGEDLVAPLLNLSVDSPQDPKHYRCEWIGYETDDGSGMCYWGTFFK
jgi:hypothetical protein